MYFTALLRPREWVVADPCPHTQICGSTWAFPCCLTYASASAALPCGPALFTFVLLIRFSKYCGKVKLAAARAKKIYYFIFPLHIQ